MTRLISKLPLAWIAMSGVFLWASGHPQPELSNPLRAATSAVSATEVAATINRELRRRGSAEAELVSARDLEFPGTVSVPGGNSLEVSSISWDVMLRAWQFRLGCQNPASCLPFLVTAHLPASRFPEIRDKGRPPGTVLGPVEPATSVLRIPSTHATMLVKAGQPARVVVERAGMRITVQVICLERGSQGQLIRVRHRDSRGVFAARVVAAGLLESATPEEVLP